MSDYPWSFTEKWITESVFFSFAAWTCFTLKSHCKKLLVTQELCAITFTTVGQYGVGVAGGERLVSCHEKLTINRNSQKLPVGDGRWSEILRQKVLISCTAAGEEKRCISQMIRKNKSDLQRGTAIFSIVVFSDLYIFFSCPSPFHLCIT